MTDLALARTKNGLSAFSSPRWPLHFIKHVITLKTITPVLNEKEIVTVLAERFDQLIQDTKYSYNIREFEELLQREHIRKNNNQTTSSSNHGRIHLTIGDGTAQIEIPSLNKQTIQIQGKLNTGLTNLNPSTIETNTQITTIMEPHQEPT